MRVCGCVLLCVCVCVRVWLVVVFLFVLLCLFFVIVQLFAHSRARLRIVCVYIRRAHVGVLLLFSALASAFFFFLYVALRAFQSLCLFVPLCVSVLVFVSFLNCGCRTWSLNHFSSSLDNRLGLLVLGKHALPVESVRCLMLLVYSSQVAPHLCFSFCSWLPAMLQLELTAACSHHASTIKSKY